MTDVDHVRPVPDGTPAGVPSGTGLTWSTSVILA